MKTTRRTALAMLGTLPAAAAEAAASRRSSSEARVGRTLPAAKLGVLYPYVLTQDMRDAIAAAWRPNVEIEFRENLTANNEPDRARLEQAITELNDAQCTAIVAFGGLVVHDVISQHRTNAKPFFSMVGRKPGEWGGRGLGGVTVHTPLSNRKRIRFLLEANPPLQPNEIALYRYNGNLRKDGNSVYDLEQRTWHDRRNWGNRDPGPIIDSTGDFNADFNGGRIPAMIRGVIVSASPSFLGRMTVLTAPNTPMPEMDNRNNLVLAANAWIAAQDSRRIVYPFQDFLSQVADQARARSFAKGPSLTRELRRLVGYAKAPAKHSDYDRADGD